MIELKLLSDDLKRIIYIPDAADDMAEEMAAIRAMEEADRLAKVRSCAHSLTAFILYDKVFSISLSTYARPVKLHVPCLTSCIAFGESSNDVG